MDWDRVNATDIFGESVSCLCEGMRVAVPVCPAVFLSSFKPQAGSIVRVSVLPSDFGLERMQSEDKQGPTELLSQSDDTLDEGSLEGRGYSNERLRQYQLQRLNFYYAVVECDSPGQCSLPCSDIVHVYGNMGWPVSGSCSPLSADTASHVYEQCDGLEYEHCGGKLDLR